MMAFPIAKLLRNYVRNVIIEEDSANSKEYFVFFTIFIVVKKTILHIISLAYFQGG